jgi:hypothetical protein
MRQTIFNSSPARGGTLPGPSASPQTDALRLVPSTSFSLPKVDGVAHCVWISAFAVVELLLAARLSESLEHALRTSIVTAGIVHHRRLRNRFATPLVQQLRELGE